MIEEIACQLVECILSKSHAHADHGQEMLRETWTSWSCSSPVRVHGWSHACQPCCPCCEYNHREFYQGGHILGHDVPLLRWKLQR